MCGITGFLNPKRAMGADKLKTTVLNMAASIAARGPDAFGAWVDEAAGIALGHRRLSILDLSSAGAQPMISRSSRYVISYNGEIYNFAELRAELENEGVSFRGHSDTEVLVEACDRWGIDRTVSRLIGMFAFALWDCQERRLTLVRDRLGIKPLYWGKIGDYFFFGSQPRSFSCHPAWTGAIDRAVLGPYFQFGYVPAPLSIYEGIEQVSPGEIITLDDGGQPKRRKFWDASEVARHGAANRITLDDAGVIEQFETLLRDAVERRMLADVPLGAFLSGGVDSSTVVAMMQEISDRPVRTFSIGFEDDRFDEAKYAKQVAQHLGTDHEELYVDSKTALDVIPQISEWLDEPFADSSLIPTFLVSQLARRSVTTVLSGDGGDEVFAGYSRYALGNALWRRIGKTPIALRRLGGSAIRAIAEEDWNKLATVLPRRWRPPHLGARAHKLGQMLQQPDPSAFYRLLVSQWSEPETITGGGSVNTMNDWAEITEGISDPIERMQLLDLVTYLPNDILTKVDRASMAVSLEARVPLIDHRIVEFAARLPMHFKIRNGESKWLLRQVLYRRVPRALIERPKMGFGVPLGDWLTGPLRDWAEDLLSPQRLAEDGLLNPAPIRQMWQDHLSNKVRNEHRLWCVLMFQTWRSHEKARRTG